MTKMPHKNSQKIKAITLDERTVVKRAPEIEMERNQAINDLLHNNSFAPAGQDDGPYSVNLSIRERRLVMEVSAASGDHLNTFIVPLSPFSRLIKDYFLVCESYFEAIRNHLPPSKIEALDMGRRGLHNEGADMLRNTLADKVRMDINTSRRLFTLICVLHI